MQGNSKSITNKQFVILILIMGISLKMFMLPTLFLEDGGKDGYVSMAIWLILDILILLSVLFVRRLMPTLSYYEILEKCFKKVIAKSIVVFLTVYYIFKLTLIVGEIKTFFSTTLHNDVPWVVFIIPLLAILMCFSVWKAKTIARTAEIFIPFIIIGIIGMMALSFNNVMIENLLPLQTISPKKVLETAFMFPLWFGDFSILIFFLGNHKPNKNLKKSKSGFSMLFPLISAGLASVIVITFCLVVFANYANITHLVDYGHNLSTMVHNNVGSQTYGRYDQFLLCFWVLALMLLGSLYSKTIVENGRYLFNKEKPLLYGGILMGIIYILSVTILLDPANLLLIATGAVMRVISLIAIIGVPLILLICAFVLKKKGVGKDEQE